MSYRIFASSALERCPQVFLKIPYLLVFYFMRAVLIFYSRKSKLFYRNSVAFKAIQPLYSDLDLTLLSANFFLETSSERQLLQTAGKVFLMTGELNVYSTNTLSKAVAYMNPFEKMRDLSLESLPGRNLDIYGAVYFINRMLQSDWRALEARPRTRLKKWNYLLNLTADFITPPKNISTQHIFNMFDVVVKDQDALEKLRGAFPELTAQSTVTPWVLCFFIHKLCYRCNEFDQLTHEQLMIAIEGVKWEIWALYTQGDNFSRESAIKHIKNLIYFLDWTKSSLVTNLVNELYILETKFK